MYVEVAGDPGAGTPAEVRADVDSLGRIGRFDRLCRDTDAVPQLDVFGLVEFGGKGVGSCRGCG